MAERDELRAEVTEWQERNERLSVEAGRISVERDELHTENERLQGEASLLAEALGRENTEVERLRAALTEFQDRLTVIETREAGLLDQHAEIEWLKIALERKTQELETAMARVKQLEVELRGYEWGMSNAVSDLRAIRESNADD